MDKVTTKYAHGIMAIASSQVKYCNQNITQIVQFAARIVEGSQPLQTCKQMCSAGSLLEDSSCQSCLLLGILWRKKWHYSRGSVRKQIWIWFYVFRFEQLWWLWMDDVAPDMCWCCSISHVNQVRTLIFRGIKKSGTSSHRVLLMQTSNSELHTHNDELYEIIST